MQKTEGALSGAAKNRGWLATLLIRGGMLTERWMSTFPWPDMETYFDAALRISTDLTEMELLVNECFLKKKNLRAYVCYSLLELGWVILF